MNLHRLRARHSTIAAYLALFFSLAGTGYAALSLPAGSVTDRAIRRGAITADRLNPTSIGGVVRYFAVIATSGRIVKADTTVKTIGSWSTGLTSGGGGIVRFTRGIEFNRCVAAANVVGVGDGTLAQGFADVRSIDDRGDVFVNTFQPGGQATPLPVVVEVLCR